jgi:hypothetical protein
VIALALAATLAAGPAPGPDPLEARRAEIAAELVRLGGALRREIEAGDVDALLARVPAEGLRCGDRVVPRSRVARDLRSPRSWLRGVFFGGPGFVPPEGVAPSLRALFQGSSEVAVLVAFASGAGAGAGQVGRPCIDFRAKGVGTPGAPLCFEARGGRWLFTQSLYPCR